MKKITIALAVSLLATAFLAAAGFAAEGKGDESSTSCVEPVKGPLVEGNNGGAAINNGPRPNPAPMRAQVGKPVIDFEAHAYHNGKFRNVKLSDYKGQWVVLCFYPGDFTFV